MTGENEMRKISNLIIFLIVLGAAAHVGAEEYSTYVNEKFGYEVKYPNNIFQPLEGAEIDAGMVFISEEKTADMRVNAAEQIFDITLKYEFEDMLDTDVIDKTLDEKEGWFSVTSLRGSTVVYVKKILKNGVYYTLEIEYPYLAKGEFEPIVKAVSESFRVLPKSAD